MSALRLAVLVVLGVPCCVFALTRNTRDCDLASMVVRTLQHTIGDVEHMRETCKGSTAVVDNEALPPPSLQGGGAVHITAKLETIEGKLGEVEQKVDAFNGQLQNVREELQSVKEKVNGVGLRMEGVQDNLEGQLQYIQHIVQGLAETTQSFAEAVEKKIMEEKKDEAPPERASVYPCLDSTFSGSGDSTCQLAVRFSRCSLPKVSYHCCRTCTDAGQLPETGPWRYQNLSRTVTTLETMRFFLP